MNHTMSQHSLQQLLSESRNPETMALDTLDPLALVSAINREDKKVATAIESVLPEIARAVEIIAKAFQLGGRLIYCGAGTSGRLGVLDAVECPPTFGVSDQQVIGLIAGGKEAMFVAQEGAEDSGELGQHDLEQIHLSDKDVVVGLAASGRTPYVIGALNYASARGCHTISVTCNPNTPLTTLANTVICPVVGPEALTGSTRLKAGSAQKMVLNMLTTASMVRSGKAYQNLMVDVKATNVKLKARSVKIVMQATDCSEEEARQALLDSDQQAKLAILMLLTGKDKSAASALLSETEGHLRQALSSLLPE